MKAPSQFGVDRSWPTLIEASAECHRVREDNPTAVVLKVPVDAGFVYVVIDPEDLKC